MGYSIVAYSPALDSQIAALQTHLWSADPAVNMDYLRWKYTENPYVREAAIQVAVDDGCAVAMRGLCGALWELDGGPSPHVLPTAEDFVVAPKYRNSGVARAIQLASLAEGRDRGFSYALSFSARPVTFVASLATGWRYAGGFPALHRAGPSGASGEGRWQRLRHRGHVLPDVLEPEGRALRAGSVISFSTEPRPREMEELVGRLPWDGRIRHVRDARYFAWRFGNPLHDYRFLYWDEDRLEGYLVLQAYGRGRFRPACVNVADWEASSRRIHARLLELALTCCGTLDVRAWAADAQRRSLLHACGFLDDVRGGTKRGVLARRLGAAADDEGVWMLGQRNLLDPGSWDLHMLYSMMA